MYGCIGDKPNEKEEKERKRKKKDKEAKEKGAYKRRIRSANM
jgi:hypothetical protein